MSAGWSCSHQVGNICDLLNQPCEPGMKGCTLYGKAIFANPNTPSNEAFVTVKRCDEKRRWKN
ncbi:MAG: hypothetical protein DSY46_02410 [Hydrogenimonas sp.]|nr:MAG: hypothetical protein DSY46_02410 [Hydrogenimonas sp.]